MKTIEAQCKAAYLSSRSLAAASTEQKNDVLKRMSELILENQDHIISENQKDLENGKENGLTKALLDRLMLNKERLQGISDSIRDIQHLEDPIGEVMNTWTRPNGLKINKVRVPLGVVGMIYEARPNVTADAAALCLKTGNAVILRGSSSAYHSNLAITSSLKTAVKEAGLNDDVIQLLEDTSREGVKTFVQMKEYLTLIIPRGGASLIQNVVNTATVPTIETGVGNCHTYVHQDADFEKAISVTVNAKTQRPSVCCACESLLVDKAISETFLPQIIERLTELGVECRGCEETKAIVSSVKEATEEDWGTEFHDMIISVKVVSNIDDAISHIHKYGTLHSEAIISKNDNAIKQFTQEVDASAVLANTSTRFVDGGQFGFGAEIGISTQKLHARGPMALPEMTSYKYVVYGDGQIRTS